MTNSPLKHIVFVAGPSWGHLRPALKFATRTVEKFPHAFISVYVHGPQAPKALDYLSTQSLVSQERVRVVPSVPAVNPTGAPLEASVQISSPLEVISDMEIRFALWIATELKVTGLGVNGSTIEPPSWILEDHINGGISLASKDAHGLSVVSWWLGPAISLISHVGNVEHGHGGRLIETIAASFKRDGLENGRTFLDIYNQELTNRLVCIPGLPPHYEHEQIPQMLPFLLPFVVPMMERWAYMINNVDYVALCTNFETEPIATETFAHAFSKPVTPFFVGPAVDPPSTLTNDPRTNLTAKTSPVSQFLDRAYTDLAAKATGLNTQFIDKATAAGTAIFPDWTDQSEVLEHPAIHYFLSHAGWNSTIESVVRGVPMIFWPFAADQPTNTMQIATQQDCGFELIQVRTGPARSTSYHQHGDVTVHGTNEAVRDEIRKVLALSKGPRGEQQRRNTKALGEVVLASLAKGGSGDDSLGRLGELLGLSNA
ncbi:hypothetical protein BDV93DRAFT_554463 [Ceratobasidium sp. AG-I]|nr:hypothetical protein BDV93DRAFT_554463 [Ceratobasidium sp. AG-I]